MELRFSTNKQVLFRTESSNRYTEEKSALHSSLNELLQQLPVKSTQHTRVDDVPDLYQGRDLPESAEQTALVHQKKL